MQKLEISGFENNRFPVSFPGHRKFCMVIEIEQISTPTAKNFFISRYQIKLELQINKSQSITLFNFKFLNLKP